MKLRVGKRAERQARRLQAWWEANRPAAPSLFLDELEQTFRHICDARGAGLRWPTPRRPSMRRILMPETRNHVYFVVDEAAEAVHVYAVWGAPKGTTPKL